MSNPYVLAILAAALVALLTTALRRPRQWIVRQARRLWLAISPRQNEMTRLAIERIASELTMRRCMEEGNPDDEYRDDFYRWFTGDPDANVDYERKQQRDLERLKRGDFLPGNP
jgi:hypothetical protein